MEELKLFQVYKQRRDGSYFHVTSIRADSLKKARQVVKKDYNNNFKIENTYRVLGIQIDTGQPYDDRDFPYHIYRRIENKGKKIKYHGYIKPK